MHLTLHIKNTNKIFSRMDKIVEEDTSNYYHTQKVLI